MSTDFYKSINQSKKIVEEYSKFRRENTNRPFIPRRGHFSGDLAILSVFFPDCENHREKKAKSSLNRALDEIYQMKMDFNEELENVPQPLQVDEENHKQILKMFKRLSILSSEGKNTRTEIFEAYIPHSPQTQSSCIKDGSGDPFGSTSSILVNDCNQTATKSKEENFTINNSSSSEEENMCKTERKSAPTLNHFRRPKSHISYPHVSDDNNTEYKSRRVSGFSQTYRSISGYLEEKFSSEHKNNIIKAIPALRPVSVFCSKIYNVKDSSFENTNMSKDGIQSKSADTETILQTDHKIEPALSSEHDEESKSESTRVAAINELISTEEIYVDDLKIIIDVFKKKLTELCILHQDVVNTLFSNVEELLDINESFLARLKERQNDSPNLSKIGDILVEVVQYLDAYTNYCSNYPIASRLLYSCLSTNVKFSTTISEISASPECRGLSFASFLIKPVQRICKYPLIFQTIQKNTSKIHKDTINLQLSIKRLNEVIHIINTSTEKLDEKEILKDILLKADDEDLRSIEGKKLIMNGVVGIYENFRVKERHILLLEDTFVILKVNRRNNFKPVKIVYLNNFTQMVASAEQLKYYPLVSFSKHAFKLSIKGNINSMIIVVNTEEEKKRWIDSVEFVNTKIKKMIPSTLPPMLYKPDKDIVRSSSRKQRKNYAESSSVSNPDIVDSEKVNNALSQEGDASLPQENNEKIIENKSVGEWKMAVSAMSVVYYYNTVTKETSWVLPKKSNAELKPPEEQSKIQQEREIRPKEEPSANVPNEISGPRRVVPVDGYPSWYCVKSIKRPYYFNSITRESKWQLPVK